MTPLGWGLVIVGVVLLFFLIQILYLSGVLGWEDQRTRGLAYYGLPPDERAAFKARLGVHARRLYPVLRVMGRFSHFTFEKASFEHRGLKGPRGTCTPESFAAVDSFEPAADDVFVVTQMKCGTTWMQHLVYEVLHRGEGDLVETGRALYAVSPWLEAIKSVPADEAPRLGEERPSRLIKTHMPASRCPRGPGARYVYVARHPVSCFASCADFIAANAGAMAPDLDAIEAWFCSDDMWWGPWPEHIAGWWEASESDDHTLFVQFEEMKRELPGVVRRVAGFLGMAPLSEREVEQIAAKCDFAYMRRHAATFEMHPPHLLATDAELFVSGKAERHRDTPPDVRERVLRWCAARLAGSPVARLYPDLADHAPEG